MVVSSAAGRWKWDGACSRSVGRPSAQQYSWNIDRTTAGGRQRWSNVVNDGEDRANRLDRGENHNSHHKKPQGNPSDPQRSLSTDTKISEVNKRSGVGCVLVDYRMPMKRKRKEMEELLLSFTAIHWHLMKLSESVDLISARGACMENDILSSTG
jgi:hypothetical protein